MDLSSPQMGELCATANIQGGEGMTLRDIEIDQIMDKIEAQRAMNNRYFCEWMRETLKCPRCAPLAKRMIGKVVRGDEKITELDKVLCA